MASDMRRLRGRSARRVHPHLSSVDAHLFLPHRDPFLDFLDHEAAGVERLGAMRRRGGDADARLARGDRAESVDRKSTRLNSSHGYISYAVFCLKKKKQN